MAAVIERGSSAYQIVTPGRWAAVENHAAFTLRDALYRMTGVRLPVRYAHQRCAEQPAILVGAMVRRGEGAPDTGLWPRDRIEVLPQGRDLVIRGVPRRATHYAVNAFLETQGVRYYGPGNTVYPKRSRVDLPTKPLVSSAAFAYRHVFYPTAQEPEWALRWGLNVHSGRDPRWGENASAHSFGHSFGGLVPARRYAESHPEYYSLVDGVRRPDLQLCCTSEDVAGVACATMEQWVKENPGQEVFAVGMNDCDGWCECERCAAVDREEGGPTGQLLTLVNRVAERFPERIIATLAYAWALDPPKRTPAADNVLIVLCHNEGCYTHALDRCEHNRPFLDRLAGWKRMSKRILIWDYFVNYHSYVMPTPNISRIARDFRTYRKMGIEAMFCQGSAVRGGQFEGLRQYLQARLLWDPSADEWEIAAEWLRGVHGRSAGKAILDYLRLLERHVVEHDVHMTSFGAGQEQQPALFTPGVLARGKKLWDRAEKASGRDPERQHTVLAARAPEMCSRLFHSGSRYTVKGGMLRPEPPVDTKLRERFVRAALLAGAAHLREDEGAPEDFGRRFGKAYAAQTLESEELRLTAVPELGGRIYSLVWKPLGLELMRVYDLIRYVNFGPYDAGYQFALEHEWHGKGSAWPFRVVAHDAKALEMTAGPTDGLAVHTRYALKGDTVDVEHIVTNKGRAPSAIAAYAHPEWARAVFGDDSVLRTRKADGSWQEMAANPEHREGRRVVLTGAGIPAGAWAVVSPAHGIAVGETFDAGATQNCRFVVSRSREHTNLEVRYAPQELAPGKSWRCALRWKVGPVG